MWNAERLNPSRKKDKKIVDECLRGVVVSVQHMKLRDQIKKLPAGEIIQVEASSMTLVRYHARGFRDIVSRANLKTGKRDVLLGQFFVKPGNGAE
jgi:hypothetical protein